MRSEAVQQRVPRAGGSSGGLSGRVGPEAGGEVAEGQEDWRASELRRTVYRLRGELRAYPAELPDRRTAEEALDVLDGAARESAPYVPRLRWALLLVAGAVGSVSALSDALCELRVAVDRLSAQDN